MCAKSKDFNLLLPHSDARQAVGQTILAAQAMNPNPLTGIVVI